MRIIKVIHGYPMRYNAGSEVYSQMLCQGLADRHEVHVFTREEDPFKPDYVFKTEADSQDARVTLHLVNLLSDRQRYRYQHENIDQHFVSLLDKVKPHIVHIGHLNHLSTSLIHAIHQYGVPMVYTLHDYWLMCPRGQFIQRLADDEQLLWPVCDSQEDKKCATHCYKGCFSGSKQYLQQEIEYWHDWVKHRMAHMRDIARLIDYFIAPSEYLYNRFVKDFDIPKEKITYLDYGFDLKRFARPRDRDVDEPFTYGYIGTHIPAKGIQHLIKAFGWLQGNCILRIWGRPSENTAALKAIADTLPLSARLNIQWMGEYDNQNIINDVFNKADCIVVPSIWMENSPLVIHEALQARLPVITADVGGMAEYIEHEKNGLLFEHRNLDSLAVQMQRLLDNPDFARQLGRRGYLSSIDGNILDMSLHIQQIEQIYQRLLTTRN